jgi:hypothetical protein
MPTAPALADVVRLLERRRDQRAHRRYPISLSVDYKLLCKGRVDHVGSGETLNVSSGGVCFRCAESLPAGGSIELVMNWPFLLGGVCRLKLVMHGRIVRAEGQRIAIQADQHEFRTAGTRASLNVTGPRGAFSSAPTFGPSTGRIRSRLGKMRY